MGRVLPEVLLLVTRRELAAVIAPWGKHALRVVVAAVLDRAITDHSRAVLVMVAVLSAAVVDDDAFATASEVAI